jgi:hypothetical protein
VDRRLIYALVVVFVTSVALAVANVAYTNHVNEARERDRARQGEQARAAVCALINANVDVYAETPPQTAAGVNLLESWRTLKAQFGC